MDNDVTNQLIGLGTVPAVLMLVQVFKAFITDTRLYPLIAMGIGVIIHILIAFAFAEASSQGLAQHILQGVVVGLAASGLYSSVSTYREGNSADKKGHLPGT